jgi:hypothetical protein
MSRINRTAILGLTVAALALAGRPTRAAAGPITLTVVPSVAPNAFGSPSFPGYAGNAIAALESGATSGGTAGLPTFYQALPAGGTVDASQLIVSGFPSWLGRADPGGAFGPSFANELGNRLHFGLAVVAAPGTTFSLSQLSFSMASTDPGNTFQFAGDFSDPTDPTNVYSPTRVGVLSDGTLVTSGPATQAVSALYYVGVGNAIAPGDIGATGTDQEQLDQVRAFLEGLGPFQISTTYTLTTGGGTFTGTSFVNVGEVAVPEPASALVWGAAVGVGGFLVRRLRRARRPQDLGGPPGTQSGPRSAAVRLEPPWAVEAFAPAPARRL